MQDDTAKTFENTYNSACIPRLETYTKNMTLLNSYYLPGLFVQDYSIDVPLDWKGKDPSSFNPPQGTVTGFASGQAGRSDSNRAQSDDGATIKFFYRVLASAEHAHDELPLLIFLQGGPGGAGPRPYSLSSIPWIEEACRHYRVVLPDQRGTGRSNRVDSHVMSVFADNPRAGADFLHHFLADSIIRDCEYLRLSQFGGAQWTSLGQSYGGFLTLTYLSLFPQALRASFITGGVMHIPGSAHELYEHTVPRMFAKTQQYYQCYPEDKERLTAIADYVEDHDVRLPNGDPLSVRRLQMMGSDFGMKPSFERMHWTLDQAFVGGDGSLPGRSDRLTQIQEDREGEKPAVDEEIELTDGFLQEVMNCTATYSNPLYWTLQEFIYANRDCGPTNWAAYGVINSDPRFAVDSRPLALIGEAALPQMFQEDSSLKPFKQAVELMMQDSHWGTIYDPDQLSRNDVPLYCAVYFDDMYVDSSLQLDTLSRVGNSHPWVTNQFEHDGVRSGNVFAHLYQEALNRGDLDRSVVKPRP